MKKRLSNKTIRNLGIIGAALIIAAMIVGTLISGFSAKNDSERSAREVSLLYLDELASRREEVVDSNIQGRIADINTALDLMVDSDLADIPSLQKYQAKMKRIYKLDKFAFVDTEGVIYTSLGLQDNIDEYSFDYNNLSSPEVSIFNLAQTDKKVVIAVPTEKTLNDKNLVVCFMEIDMQEMLAGVSMGEGTSNTTFSNIYTKDGIALSNTILGGLAAEANLLDALEKANYVSSEDSFEKVKEDFASGRKGIVSFTYDGVSETLSYVPVNGTDWFLTYLIRESVITDKVNAVSNNIVIRSIITTSITALLLVSMFIYIIIEFDKNSKIELERETLAAISKAKDEDNVLLSQALEAAEQANKAKTVFLSNMSHEIRTPMNAIIGLNSIALNDPNLPEKTREYLVKIGVSAEHLLVLINDILDMSRIESGRLSLRNEEFSFSKLLEHINAMFSGQSQEKQLQYQCQLIGDIQDYYIGDNIKLRQVLINILGNAVKFTNPGGTISLSVEKKREYDNKEVLKFVISDTGIGMSEDFIPHVFDSFAQEDPDSINKYGSSGLGLTITKNIVELMNGHIAVESKKGEGTTFTVTITLGKTERQKESSTNKIRPEDMSVLIIDDDEVALKHAELVLGKVGIKSTLADSGKEALEIVKNHHARMEPFNLILIDWKMPEMDGVETAREIRKIIGHESAIIILTAYKWDEILSEASEVGVDSFLSKPLFANAVISEFEDALDRKRIVIKEEEISLKGRRVLLAEDVEINAEIMMEILSNEGIEVEHAENGRIALDMFTKNETNYYDAILMDMRMPEMNGLEATKAIRELNREDAKKIPIIALTANAFDEDVQRSLQAGLNAHLSKPIQPDVLFATLKEFIKNC